MTLLEARGVVVDFVERGRVAHAVRGIDLHVGAGEAVGLVGESGSGKSTLGRVLLGLLKATAGTAAFAGVDLSRARGAQLKSLRRRLQPVFQDASSALDPRLTVAEAIEEPLVVQRVGTPESRRSVVAALLSAVRLPSDVIDRRPRTLSAGQRQRVTLARALALEPELLVLDEPLSALDASVQAQLVEVLIALRAARPLALLFISHDLHVVRALTTRVAVVYAGRVVEEGSTGAVLDRPRHPFTRALVTASKDRLGWTQGEPPSVFADPPGCAYAPRCLKAQDGCHVGRPALDPGAHRVACFHPEA